MSTNKKKKERQKHAEPRFKEESPVIEADEKGYTGVTQRTWQSTCLGTRQASSELLGFNCAQASYPSASFLSELTKKQRIIVFILSTVVIDGAGV